MRPFLDFRKFRSIDNSRDPRRLDSDKTGLYRVLENVDADDQLMLHMKLGHVLLQSLTDPHSLWSNGNLCFVMDDDTFYRVNEDNTVTLLLAGITNQPMDYVDRGDGVIFFTNNYVIGYFDTDVHVFPTVSQNRKVPMIGGSLIDYFNSRLYTAYDDTLYYSDAGRPMIMDEEHGFARLGGRIKLLEFIADGAFVGVGDKVIFLVPDAQDPPNFLWRKISDSPAIFGSGMKVEGIEYAKGITGTVALWLSEDGIYMGMPEGRVAISSGSTFFTQGIERAAGTYRYDREWEMCTWAFQYKPDQESSNLKIMVPAPTISLANIIP